MSYFDSNDLLWQGQSVYQDVPPQPYPVQEQADAAVQEQPQVSQVQSTPNGTIDADSSLDTRPAWTLADDGILLTARAAGKKWEKIQSDHFPNKSPNACRKHYERLMKSREQNGLDRVRLESLAQSYMSRREEIWRPLAEASGEDWRVAEATVRENLSFSS
ncbi:hypothetical protein K3495_g9729 [Podosphaera aphanis]|nr:hypothetical protein K3495_g9729 [Podosphaera aphanis]